MNKSPGSVLLRYLYHVLTLLEITETPKYWLGLAYAEGLAYNVDDMHGLPAENIQHPTSNLALGPLVYQLVAHDSWGEQMVACLNAHLDMEACERLAPDRIIHLYSLPQGSGNRGEERALPEKLASWLPDTATLTQWSYRRDLLNTVWFSEKSKHCFWTAGISPQLGSFRYHLPWNLLLHDMRLFNGGLIHGGLAEQQGAALLLLAPPDGGKTTTLAAAPTSWQVLSDDAALIWPLDNNTWQASPLPSWGMLNRATLGPTATLSRLDIPVPVRVMLRQYQSDKLHLVSVPPVAALPLIYRALCEYPAAFLADISFRPQYFQTACALAKQVPCWQLDMPLHADVWPHFEKLIKDSQS